MPEIALFGFLNGEWDFIHLTHEFSEWFSLMAILCLVEVMEVMIMQSVYAIQKPLMYKITFFLTKKEALSQC